MRLRTTLILFAVLLGLGAYVYWIELPHAEQESKKKNLFDFKVDDVSHLDLIYADREISLDRSGETWHITKPLDAKADPVAVRGVLNSISDCEVKKELADADSDPAIYGLDKPFVTVKVRLGDRELPAVAVGKNTPVGFNTYIQKLDDKKVLLTNASFRSGIDKQVNDLRDKTILNFSEADVQGITLHRPDQALQLARKGGDWEIIKPTAYRADGGAIRSFLTTMRTMRAVDFPDSVAVDTRYGFAEPRLTITLALSGDPAEIDLIVGAENPDKKTEFYVRRGDTVYAVSDWVWRDLNKSIGDFRDKTLLAFDRSNLRTIEIRKSDGITTRLTGGDTQGWHVEANDAKPAATAINQWIGDLRELKGYEVVADEPLSLAPFGLESPMLTVTLSGENNTPVGTILIGEHKPENGTAEYYGKSSAAHTVYKLRDYAVTRLNKTAKDFVEPATPGANAPSAEATDGNSMAPFIDTEGEANEE